MLPATWLWQIEPPAAPRPSFLFGTMHVRDARAFGQWPQVAAAIAATDIFATEFDLGEPPLPSLSEVADLPSLAAMGLPDKAFRKLARILRRSVGVDLYALQHLPPLFIVNLLSERMLASDHTEPLDASLYAYARSLGKPTYGLETFADQLRILERIPARQQLRALKKYGATISSQRRQLHRNLTQYENADLAGLYRSVRAQAGGYRRLLLYDRNEHMSEAFLALAHDRCLFAAVGAGHLPGGKGMLRQLKRAGCRVRGVETS